jgi:hypothetical protein
MIALIMRENPNCQDEAWAIWTVNECIKHAMENGYCSMGMCIASRYEREDGIYAVELSLNPYSDSIDAMGDLVRRAHLPRVEIPATVSGPVEYAEDCCY